MAHNPFNSLQTFDLDGLGGAVEPRQDVTLVVRRAGGETEKVPLTLRVDTPIEAEYYRHGGILQYVLFRLLGGGGKQQAGVPGGARAAAV